MPYRRLALILGDGLFPDHSGLEPDDETLMMMAEDDGLCTHFKYHKQKLVLFLSAMRNHADQLRAHGHALKYFSLSADEEDAKYEEKLTKVLQEQPGLEEVVCYDIEDHFFAKRIEDWCRANDLQLKVVDSPKFLFNQEDFNKYLKEANRPFMGAYYKRQRRALDLMLETDGEPLGGKWSFDEENRKKFPKNISFPSQPQSELNEHDQDIINLVKKRFADHPGHLEQFNWSTTRRSALAKLDDFLKQRFELFGPYEDAIHHEEAFAFHSVLSPYLNMGLITPREVLDRVVEYWQNEEVHYPSVEGYVRQIIGWREFLRGIYHNYPLQKNYFNHQRKLKKCWYDGTTGLKPVDDTIKKAQRHAYTHHIERLMIMGNIMLMTGIDPREVYRWFMEMYIDSADWVMAPNVFGMSQFAEGGIFATKPYISGSNYIRKMSNYPKGDWCEIVDGLYWSFIDRHKETFAKNQRMSMMLATLRRMNEEKKDRIFKAAREWTASVTE